jgi:molecular chaperone DnaK (HSP70)
MIVAIDFGASMTKAALYRGVGEATSVSIDDAPESSSAVFLQPDGELICGVAADNSSRRRPERLQAALKRRISQSTK